MSHNRGAPSGAPSDAAPERLEASAHKQVLLDLKASSPMACCWEGTGWRLALHATQLRQSMRRREANPPADP